MRQLRRFVLKTCFSLAIFALLVYNIFFIFDSVEIRPDQTWQERSKCWKSQMRGSAFHSHDVPCMKDYFHYFYEGQAYTFSPIDQPAENYQDGFLILKHAPSWNSALGSKVRLACIGALALVLILIWRRPKRASPA